MASIKNKNTKPELLVRKAVHRMGFRFRLHRIDLPGKPQDKFTVLGRKRAKNVKRDKENFSQLRQDGWDVLIAWECWTKKPEILGRELKEFLY